MYENIDNQDSCDIHPQIGVTVPSQSLISVIKAPIQKEKVHLINQHENSVYRNSKIYCKYKCGTVFQQWIFQIIKM